MSLRIYVRATSRVILGIKTLLSDIADIFANLLQIREKKEKIIKNVTLSKACLERKREAMNSESLRNRTTTIDFVR